MRLFLLPISSRRTLLYCERLPPPAHHPPPAMTLTDKAQLRAARLWADWEQKPTGSWQRRVATYGNAAFRRIALEEWGLKSVPSLSARRRLEKAAAGTVAADDKSSETTTGDENATFPPVQVVFPPSILPPGSIAGLLHRLSTEREALHRQRMLWCFIGMPITAPIAIIPVVPNLPFFYLVYRAWSHWRAISGGKHTQHLLQHDELVLAPSPTLDAIYAQQKTQLAARSAVPAGASAPGERQLLSHPEGTKAVADAYEAPQLAVELERAVWQVETSIAKERKAASLQTEAQPASGTGRDDQARKQKEKD